MFVGDPTIAAKDVIENYRRTCMTGTDNTPGSKTMIGQLTKAERQYALLILLGIALCGLILGIAGKDDPLGIHGALIGVVAIAGIFKVISIYYDPEPGDERLTRYYDDPTKFGIILAMIWARVRPLYR